MITQIPADTSYHSINIDTPPAPFSSSNLVHVQLTCRWNWKLHVGSNTAIINPAKMQRLISQLRHWNLYWKKSLCKSTHIGIDPLADCGRVIPFGTTDLFHLLWQFYDHYSRFERERGFRSNFASTNVTSPFLRGLNNGLTLVFSGYTVCLT